MTRWINDDVHNRPNGGKWIVEGMQKIDGVWHVQCDECGKIATRKAAHNGGWFRRGICDTSIPDTGPRRPANIRQWYVCPDCL